MYPDARKLVEGDQAGEAGGLTASGVPYGNSDWHLSARAAATVPLVPPVGVVGVYPRGKDSHG
jgi:hypothetical protein